MPFSKFDKLLFVSYFNTDASFCFLVFTAVYNLDYTIVWLKLNAHITYIIYIYFICI